VSENLRGSAQAVRCTRAETEKKKKKKKEAQG